MDKYKLSAIKSFWTNDFTESENKDETLKLAQKDVNNLIAEISRLQEELQSVHESAFVYSWENKSLKEQRQELWEENERLRTLNEANNLLLKDAEEKVQLIEKIEGELELKGEYEEALILDSIKAMLQSEGAIR